jgi:hypothetical protein
MVAAIWLSWHSRSWLCGFDDAKSVVILNPRQRVKDLSSQVRLHLIS